RIEAVTGRGAEQYITQRLADLARIAQYLDAEPDNLLDKAQSLSIELKNEHKRSEALEMELAHSYVSSLAARAENINGVKVVSAELPSHRMEILRAVTDWLRDNLKSGIIVLGSVYEDKPIFIVGVTPDLVSRGYDAAKIVREVAKVTGGGGGGKATLAQAGGKDKDKLDEALRLVKKLI
ncbi:MAG: alaS, partial [Dehalococcoidales bacterium]|nr:alaS [Dehalococcoidales bacterium]